MITWTIGAGGMLGRAVASAAPASFTGSAVPWHDSSLALATLKADLSRFVRDVGTDQWAIVWAAGEATVSTSPAATAKELHTFETFLIELRTTHPAGRGAFFLASSAGGVYAGSIDPPFSVSSQPRALSAYGDLKLDQERMVQKSLADVCPTVIGRFSNLYGVGQNLGKLQGLISRLALAAATQQPLNVFVSLDTIRDYIYVEDAAAIAHWWLADTMDRQLTTGQLAVIASGEGTTIGQLIRTMHLVTKRRVPVALGSHSSSDSQVLDLRLTPTNAPALRGLASTPLPSGVKSVYLDVLRQVQDAAVTSSPR